MRRVVLLKWYCDKRVNEMCFRQETRIENVSPEGMDEARRQLFALPFSFCTCGASLVRSMRVLEEA